MGPIGILYEHPLWFEPLFDELERRGVDYERISADRLTYEPTKAPPSYSIVFNRMSPRRGAGVRATPFSTHSITWRISVMSVLT